MTRVTVVDHCVSIFIAVKHVDATGTVLHLFPSLPQTLGHPSCVQENASKSGGEIIGVQPFSAPPDPFKGRIARLRSAMCTCF